MLLTIGVILLASSSNAYVQRLDISQCNATIANMLQADPAFAFNNSVFFSPPVSPGNATLTMNACDAICTVKSPVVKDCATRLVQWFLPVLFLVIAIPTSPSALWFRVEMSLRPIADHFHAAFSVVSLLATTSQSYLKAEDLLNDVLRERPMGPELRQRLIKSLALILYSLPETSHGTSRDGDYLLIRELIASRTLTKNERIMLICQTAGELAGNRSHNTLQAWSTVLICILGIVVATVPVVGGSTPSGAMIAAALTLSPLIMNVLLSNNFGIPASQSRTQKTVRDFVRICKKGDSEATLKEHLLNSYNHKHVADFDDVPFQTGTTWYQTKQILLANEDSRTWSGFAATLPLANILWSFAAAFLALAAPPAYINDRHWVLVSILATWITSAVMSYLLELVLDEWEA